MLAILFTLKVHNQVLLVMDKEVLFKVSILLVTTNMITSALSIPVCKNLVVIAVIFYFTLVYPHICNKIIDKLLIHVV